MRLLRALLVIAVFAIIGPLVGAAQTMTLVVLLWGPNFARVGSGLWWEILMVALAASLVPALLAGVAAASLADAGQPRGRAAALVLLVATLASAMLGFGISGSSTLPLVTGAVGFIGGAACLGVLELVRRVVFRSPGKQRHLPDGEPKEAGEESAPERRRP
ncbi:hypothetical protein ABLE93_12920 [Xanthobacter sp. KR7-65]|uniref:hypothetical protein n=1 Tax=Xanthobacter sp. KR7-65 TaxID=3156612 RepID=UPI0032B33E45